LDREAAVGDLLPMANMATIRMIERRAIDMTQIPPCSAYSCLQIWRGTLYRSWSIRSSDPLPAATEPMPEEDEAELLYLLATELNRKLAIGVDTKFNMVRMVATGIASNSRLILVGGQHAIGLANAARALGHQFDMIPLEDNPLAGQVSHCARKLRELVEDIPPGSRAGVLVVFAVLDSLVYMVKNSEGGVNPLRLPVEGVQHVVGELVVATGEMLEDRLARLASLLNSICGASAVLLGPLPRHLEGPCCNKQHHMYGYVATSFKATLLKRLDTARRAIKDGLFKLRIRGVQVANYARTACEKGWATPLTPNEEGYKAILHRVLDQGANKQEASRRDKEKRAPGSGGNMKKAPRRM